jgi:hypothetical protein
MIFLLSAYLFNRQSPSLEADGNQVSTVYDQDDIIALHTRYKIHIFIFVTYPKLKDGVGKIIT